MVLNALDTELRPVLSFVTLKPSGWKNGQYFFDGSVFPIRRTAII